jgi:hypothetical protein
MARRRLSSFTPLWDRHKRLYSEVFSMALLELSELDLISGNEDAISEKLCIFLSKVCHMMGKKRNQEVRTPDWEKPIPPVAINELKGGKSSKRPDFTCKCVNPWADSPENHVISYHVECKRLGERTSPTWILNENYVKNGVKRFDSKVHKYGNRACSGIMIGYIISMTPKTIEAKVNSYQKKHLPDNSNIKFEFNNSSLFKTCQNINRKNVAPVQFELIHLWIDLRDCSF